MTLHQSTRQIAAAKLAVQRHNNTGAARAVPACQAYCQRKPERPALHRTRTLAPSKNKTSKKAIPVITLSTHWNYLIVYAGLSVFVILGTVLFGHKLLDYASHTIPQSAEEKIGQLTIQSLLTNPECVEPQERASLEKMTQKLQQGMARDIDRKVRVISDNETLNAFATPGGYLVAS